MSSGKGKKRSARTEEDEVTSKKVSNQPTQDEKLEENDEDVDEDPYEDEYDPDDDDENIKRLIDDDMDIEEENEGDMKIEPSEEQKKSKKETGKETGAWNPIIDRSALAPGETLEYDPSAYEMFHSLSSEWPCLSFDIVRDNLGPERTKYPHNVTLVAGTQADSRDNNRLVIMNLYQLEKTQELDDDSDDEDSEAVDPILHNLEVMHDGGVNRIRVMPQKSNIVASWSDQGFVSIYNIESHLKWLESSQKSSAGKMPGKDLKPSFTVKGHKTEGFALDWSHVKQGRLITGDCGGEIYLTDMNEQGVFETSPKPFRGHKDSVEDLQWSPVEETIFASCSVDKTIKIWDIREKQQKAACSWQASTTDVNVISWGFRTVYLMVSGSDDGSLKVWDLRSLKSNPNECSCIAHFAWHKSPITSVAWDPYDESVFTAASEDDTTTIWDLSTERDESENTSKELQDIPAQLLFIHQGQTDVKEVRYHPQIPGVILSTASEGFDVYKASLSELMSDGEDEDEED